MAKKEKQKLIVILGQTAVGKSDFAVHLAKQFNGEIISADSRQVYKGVELMAGTITKREMKGIPHHLLSYKDIRRQYTVTNFLKDSKKALVAINKKDKVPIICGGTAMYIDALIYNQVLPEVKPNQKLRKELSKLTTEELFTKLQQLDRDRSEAIDRHNPRRLIRAIEIATALGKVPPVTYTGSDYEVLIIGLKRPPLELKERIDLRIQKRMKQGMLAETKRLLEEGVRTERLNDLGLEFGSMVKLIENPKNKKAILERLYFDIWHFAKRQATWWKRNANIIWLHPDDIEKAKLLVTEFLHKKKQL